MERQRLSRAERRKRKSLYYHFPRPLVVNVEPIDLPKQPPLVPTEKVIEATSEHFGISPEEFTKTRKMGETYVRHFTMYFLRVSSGMTYENIAQMLGLKDHSSVVHAVKTMGLRLRTDEDCRRDYQEIMDKLRSSQ